MQKSKQKQAKSENEFIIFFLCQNIHRFQYKDTTPCRITCLLSNTKQIIAIYELDIFSSKLSCKSHNRYLLEKSRHQ